ncbi:uncharacterized protein MYCFIDRAFT_78456 [Pseudocercospora fijiensis CIRAD86]|uniref:Uncharacterized protein n=1 Tax=Pseudocercospora fijiensis (strain CIRAD86) TaxID=383855 RepID=N1QD49_PSEFD|nr:uncharacterized protein MYCFIDRAFT_78456 [Pseudocercospora fijiensis CIRAD86]EME89763.1 hypothetical protein MYCFIDRAFT_78456 [Pseudocercospora fijiensis CIRAD86]
MSSGKPKRFVPPPPKKKKPAKESALESADDFQDAADYEEAAGGKHRAGDPVKSGRAFFRALEVYDKGLARHPESFDLAYNKARLQLELSQHENVLEHIGIPLLEWLKLTLESHRYALRLTEENPDVLFNTAQVLTSLAEQLREDDAEPEAAQALEEALELLSSCLSRQEMMFEQHRLDFPDTEDGGVALDESVSETPLAPAEDTDMDEQSAIVETPVGPSDLLDTVHASLFALYTLVPLADEAALQNLGEMARQFTESKAPGYLRLLPEEEQQKAHFSVAVSRARFIAAYAGAQFEHHMIELETYVERIESFNFPGKEQDLDALVAEAAARNELVLSVIDRFGEASNLPAALCWKQLTSCQDLLSKAAKLNNEEARKGKAEIYHSKGDTELLRYRIILIPNTDLADGIRSGAPTLILNAKTFYKGAVGNAKALGDDVEEGEARKRWSVAKAIAALIYDCQALDEPVEGNLMEGLEECVEQGLISEHLAEAIVNGKNASRS